MLLWTELKIEVLFINIHYFSTIRTSATFYNHKHNIVALYLWDTDDYIVLESLWPHCCWSGQIYILRHCTLIYMGCYGNSRCKPVCVLIQNKTKTASDTPELLYSFAPIQHLTWRILCFAHFSALITVSVILLFDSRSTVWYVSLRIFYLMKSWKINQSEDGWFATFVATISASKE